MSMTNLTNIHIVSNRKIFVLDTSSSSTSTFEVFLITVTTHSCLNLKNINEKKVIVPLQITSEMC